MFRFYIASMVVALSTHVAIHAQPKDPPKNFTNTIGMKFAWIPPGSFVMGSPKEEKDRNANETQHKVTLTKGFYMGVYTVTQEQWKAVMGNNPSQFKGEKNLPVETVSWDDCQEFIKKLREKDKKPYRLPTEAEWEYRLSCWNNYTFHFGDTISTDQPITWQHLWQMARKGRIASKHHAGRQLPSKRLGALRHARQCLAMVSGLVSAIIRKKTWLIRKDQKTAKNVCCVVVPLRIIPPNFARRFVTRVSPVRVTRLSVSVSASSWSKRSPDSRSFLASLNL